MSKVLDCLKNVFKYDNFRNQQENIINTILYEKRDVFSIMSTGHGKSICYQIPALVTNKPCIVVSPLISLMDDQMINLKNRGINSCTYNSTMSSTQKKLVYNNIMNNEYKVIYFTPEMITSEYVRDMLLELNKNIGISVIAIDEAHCVSMWGNSFRSSYLELSCLKRWLKDVPILALTATATSKVQEDIIKLLLLNNPLLVNTGVNKENLSYYVHQKSNIYNDIDNIINNISSINDSKKGYLSSIIYCQKRDETEKISKLLINRGINCEAYHAGLNPDIRKNIHKNFIENRSICIVATIAFGMGIDKPDIRRIIHYGCPRDIESYVQETGRAGRDGKDSECHVYYNTSDFHVNRYFLKDISDPFLRKYKEDSIKSVEKYLYLNTCRRSYILNYFGDTYTNIHTHNTDNMIENTYKCCDNCINNKKDISNNISNDITNDINLMTLNIDNIHNIDNIGKYVYDFLDFLKTYPNKFGKNMCINIIKGSNLKTIPPTYKNSKFYGIGSMLTTDTWKNYVQHIMNDELISERFIEGSYGSTIYVSKKGLEWLTTNINNPSFIIHFNDNKSPNISPNNTKKININKININKSPSNSNTSSPNNNEVLSETLMSTYRMFNEEDKNINEISKLRNLTTSTIEGHIAEIYKKGMYINLEKFGLTKSKYDYIISIINGDVLLGNTSVLSPIKGLCCSNTTYLQIKLSIIILKSGLDYPI